MKEPGLTVITPALNAGKCIRSCVESVVEQHYDNLEFLVLDGGSTDNTLNILDEYKAYSCLTVHSINDSGIYNAMNQGIDLASGEWIYFMGADDRLKPEVLNKILGDPSNHTYDVLYGNVVFQDSGKVHNGKFNSYKMMTGNICHQAIFVKKHVFDIVGKFDEDYIVYADRAFNMKWYSHPKIKHQYIDLIIAEYNEKGFSEKNVSKDEVFFRDQVRLNKRYFGVFPRMLYKFRSYAIVKYLIKLVYGVNGKQS